MSEVDDQLAAGNKGLAGNFLLSTTHVIDHRGAAFPVVADPEVVRDCGIITCTWYFSRWYTKNVLHPSIAGAGSGAAAILAGALMCGKIPNRQWQIACVTFALVQWASAVLAINKAVAYEACFTAALSLGPGYAGFGSSNNKYCSNR